MAGGIKPPKQLEVRSSTLVSAPSLVSEPGTRDVMPRVGSQTADVMPQARAWGSMGGTSGGSRTLPDVHLSWQALAGSEAPSGMMAGAGGTMTELGDHKPMAGVVQKNKAPF